jgi:hypothetical protein
METWPPVTGIRFIHLRQRCMTRRSVQQKSMSSGCDAVYCCGRIPTFRKTMLLPFSLHPEDAGRKVLPLHDVTAQKTST